MVKVKIDMTGWNMWEYGVPDSRLTVIKQVEDYITPKDGKARAQWLCECSCLEHNRVIVIGTHLRSGRVKSCGCLNKERAAYIGRSNHKENQYDLSGDIGVGWTYNTNKEFYFDKKNYDIIKSYCWFEHVPTNGTHRLMARDANNNTTIYMHILLGFKNYDHIDRNELNNLESNFRASTKQQNNRNKSLHKNNTSGFTGVSWMKQRQKWNAHITIDYKSIKLGYFDNKDDAIKARLRAEKEYFGEFAPQRHLFEQYGIV